MYLSRRLNNRWYRSLESIVGGNARASTFPACEKTITMERWVLRWWWWNFNLMTAWCEMMKMPPLHFDHIDPSVLCYAPHCAYQRYQKIEKGGGGNLGEGTYGVVYKARDKQTNTIVALKVKKLGDVARSALSQPVDKWRRNGRLLLQERWRVHICSVIIISCRPTENPIGDGRWRYSKYSLAWNFAFTRAQTPQYCRVSSHSCTCLGG